MGQRYFHFLVLMMLAILGSAAQAQTLFPRLKVVPWNGHKAATSLTFDSGDPVYLNTVIPELNRRQLKGTFFLIANKTNRKDEWRQAIKAGHEIGSQTLDGFHADVLSINDENAQVIGAQNVLQKEFGVSLYSFAYPYGEVSPGLESLVEKTSFIARGESSGLISPKDRTINWFNIPAKTTQAAYRFKAYKGWIDGNLRQGGWLVWAINGIGVVPGQFIGLDVFKRVLDYLQSKDIWVGTVLEVGSYWRAWQSFGAATVHSAGSEEVYQWVIPDHCPMNVRLKVFFPRAFPPVQIWQNGEQVVPDAQGNYAILFNQGQLNLRR